MADKFSPEDLAVWWQAYCAALTGILSSLDVSRPLDGDSVVTAASGTADASLAQYKARQHHTEGRET